MSRVCALIGASFAALEPGGWIVVHGAHLDADKTGPLPAAAYSALLMHATEGRCYSVGELFEAVGAARFVDPRPLDTAADRSLIVGRKA